MNTAEPDRNWEEQKAKLKNKFAILLNNDLIFADGKKDEIVEKLQAKLGKSKEELDSIIENI